jgi:deoxycytidylate deaminase
MRLTKKDKQNLIEQCIKNSARSGDPHLKVGAVLIEKLKYSRTYIEVAYGWNYLTMQTKNLGYKDEKDKTRPHVIHAEASAISSLFKFNNHNNKYELFCTLSPCMECAKLIYLSGIKKIYFKDFYKDQEPLNFLKLHNVKWEQIKINN